jgi:hypothetical protein
MSASLYMKPRLAGGALTLHASVGERPVTELEKEELR